MSEQEIANLSIYRITNRNTGHRRLSVSTNAQEACSALGWFIGDCDVLRLDTSQHTRPDGVKGLMLQVPCHLCPYQYAACQREPNELCPARCNVPDLQEWLSVSCKAHLCQHVGQPLFKKDYEKGLMWLTLPAAIDYINLHPH